jgi:hypothetical protein
LRFRQSQLFQSSYVTTNLFLVTIVSVTIVSVSVLTCVGSFQLRGAENDSSPPEPSPLPRPRHI